MAESLLQPGDNPDKAERIEKNIRSATEEFNPGKLACPNCGSHNTISASEKHGDAANLWMCFACEHAGHVGQDDASHAPEQIALAKDKKIDTFVKLSLAISDVHRQAISGGFTDEDVEDVFELEGKATLARLVEKANPATMKASSAS